MKIIKHLTYRDKRYKRLEEDYCKRDRKVRSRTFTIRRRIEGERNQFNELTPNECISFSFSLPFSLSILSFRVAFFR